MLTDHIRNSEPRVGSQKQLVFQSNVFHDDFLITMRRVFIAARFFGVAGTKKNIWRVWGVLMCLLLIAIEIGAIYKLVKLLMGLTAYSVGNRSVTARLAGTIFYASSFFSLILSWRLSSTWWRVISIWAPAEKKLLQTVPPDDKLKKKMIMVSVLMASGAFTDYSVWIAVPVLFMSNIATILWGFQDLLIVLISMGLTSRYQRLNQYVAKITSYDKNATEWCTHTETLKVITWRKVREAYVKQAQLVRKVDNSIGGLILLSSSGNFYFICLQLFLGITQGISGDIIKRLYYMLSLFWIILRFSLVVLAAADVNVYSKKALRYLYECNELCYNIEIERLVKQLSKDFVALSGVGFFSIDRGVLLQIAASIITYELVLIQFDGKAGSEHESLNIPNVHT